jgi:hypothetical protein
MNKQVRHTYKGMTRDITKSKFPNDFYYEGNNIRIVTTDTQSTGSVANEKGNSILLTIPQPEIVPNATNPLKGYISYGVSGSLQYNNSEIMSQYSVGGIYKMSGTQEIIGSTTTVDSIILITTDNSGFDCIWKINDSTFQIRLLYMRNLGLSTSRPIQILSNFENTRIDKIYWVDGSNQMRFLNTEHSILNEDIEELIDISSTTINMVGSFDFKAPEISRIVSGGTHTAGMIQYAYNLYRVNSSQTKLSPLSPLVALTKGERSGGGKVNESVGATPIIEISGLDPIYTHIKVYAVKYTSYNELPSISIIEEREIPGSRSISVFDDGTTIQKITLDEFIFLGSDIIVPKHIESKDNRLFLANYNEINFKVRLDTRAYSFTSGGLCQVYDNISLIPNTDQITGDSRVITGSFTDDPDWKFSSININYDLYKYQKGSGTSNILGGEGKYLKYKLTTPDAANINTKNKYFKDNEIYRLGIEFYNKYGQTTLPMWVADFRSPEGNLVNNFNSLEVELKPDFFVWLNTPSSFKTDYDKPVGYRMLIAERTVLDRTIVSSGLLGTMMINNKSRYNEALDDEVFNLTGQDLIRRQELAKKLVKTPNLLLRNCNKTSNYGLVRPLRRNEHLYNLCRRREHYNTEIQRAYFSGDTSGRFYQYNQMLQIYSPETLFNFNDNPTSGLKLRIKGLYRNTYNASWGQVIDSAKADKTVVHEGKCYFGLIPQYSSQTEKITGDVNRPWNRGFIGDGSGSTPGKINFQQYYRVYGNNSEELINGTLKDLVIFNEDFNVTSTGDPTENYPGCEDFINTSNGNRSISTLRFNPKNKYITMDSNGDIVPKEGINNFIWSPAIIKFTVRPLPAYASTPYVLEVLEEPEGSIKSTTVPPTTSTPQAGTRVIEVNTSSLPKTASPIRLESFLRIYANTITTPFECEVDVEASVGNVSTNYIKKVSLNNYYNYLDSLASVALPSQFIPTPGTPLESIYGRPELVERGQSYTSYNGDSTYRYTNSFLNIYTDGSSDWRDIGSFGRRIVRGNSDHNRCITFVLGPNDPNFDPNNRPTLESIFNSLPPNANITNNHAVYGELVKNNEQIYLGNIYGGNSYEDKRRTNYIQIGDYVKFNQLHPVNKIPSPGDTFVSPFRFLRVVRRDSEVLSEGTAQFEEIIEYVTETTIDLKNRSDLSLSSWDSKFQPRNEDFHDYNRVYSQVSNVFKKRGLNFNVKTFEKFDSNIIATKVKNAGEIIDNWTDVLPNEVMTLDGKYGSINALVNFRDKVYAIQDTGVAYLSINPRVQIQGTDGIALELGTGGVLQDYQYMSTSSGTLNKWSVVSTPQGFYYFDTLNKSLMAFKEGLGSLSDSLGMHEFFINNSILSELKIDNPILKKGISSGFDYINNEVLMTFLQAKGQSDKSFTIAYSEGSGSFTSFYDYKPSRYISKGDNFITTDPANTSIYQQHAGEYGEFYGARYDSYITVMVNPEADMDTVFDNIKYKSEVYIKDIQTLLDTDEENKTLTHVRLFNEYQDSGKVPLVVGRNSNLRRKFRDWNAILPRHKGTRQRIRNPWVFLTLHFDNRIHQNHKFILHDIVISYTI